MKPGRVYKNVTLLFADIVGFTKFSNDNGARKVVEMLSRLFTDFDKECSRLNLYKIYTIGDCYVVMGFLDQNNRKSPAEEANDVTLLAISMIKTINRVRDKLGINSLNMRIGMHTVRAFF
jgi:class 3 adenylate cyclase